MQELPAVKGNSGNGDGSAHSQQQPRAHENGGGDGGRNSAGNRWTRQETLALIKIRSDMDAAFRDSNLKSPLWDDVSRKLSELGFHRSAMKCKEKFENVYKYNKRTKEVQTSKPAGKNYRFSDQLQALESNPAVAGAVPPPPLTTVKPPPALMAIPESATVPSVPTTAVLPPLPAMNHKRTFTSLQPNVSGSTSSHISSDEEKLPEKRKKWKDFFGKLMTEVIEKQEKLQMKFLDTLEKRDRDRDAWRVKEIERMNQELDLLAGERSIAAAKDTSVIAFLQKITGENPIPVTQTPPVQKPSLQVPVPVPVLPPPAVVEVDNLLSPAPARWPKAEINALISLRTKLDVNYLENGPKGSLWEEISAAMKKLGFNRNAKRCKEKWENINKYYKKVKDGSKHRSENSKTCPYFDQLDDIYRRKEKGDNNGEAQMTPILAQPERQWPPQAAVQLSSDAICTENNGSNSVVFTVKHETQMAPIIARPEQQWPSLPAVVKEKQRQLATADMEDYDGDGYEIVPKKISSMHGCCLERER